MRTIAFVTQKGGSGKSTLASSLAVAAHEMKERVCVIDMDPQGSLTNWAKTRGGDDIVVIASGACLACDVADIVHQRRLAVVPTRKHAQVPHAAFRCP